MDQLRLFIAIELPGTIKDTLAEAQADLRQQYPPVRWVNTESMHLTLWFLGETATELLPQLGAALRQATIGQVAFALSLSHAGAFPNLRRPNVVWVGVGGAIPVLQQINERLGTALEPLGFTRDPRPFHPHLTLGRVKREAEPASQERLGTAIRQLPPFDDLLWQVERIVLFQSDLRPEGAVYTALDDARLGSKPD